MNKIKSIVVLISLLVFFIKCKDIKANADKNVISINIKKADSLNVSNCGFLNPDSSLSGIILRNPSTASKIIGANNIIDSFSQYHFYSKDKKEILTLTQHPGDENNQISIFKLELSNNSNKGYKKLNIETFKTEKGIKLGLTKSELTSLLGDCFTKIDITENEIELNYIIEQLKDSKNFLEKYNMPIYYAKYRFKEEKLIFMEFGFEYP